MVLSLVVDAHSKTILQLLHSFFLDQSSCFYRLRSCLALCQDNNGHFISLKTHEESALCADSTLDIPVTYLPCASLEARMQVNAVSGQVEIFPSSDMNLSTISGDFDNISNDPSFVFFNSLNHSLHSTDIQHPPSLAECLSVLQNLDWKVCVIVDLVDWWVFTAESVGVGSGQWIGAGGIKIAGGRTFADYENPRLACVHHLLHSTWRSFVLSRFLTVHFIRPNIFTSTLPHFKLIINLSSIYFGLVFSIIYFYFAICFIFSIYLWAFIANSIFWLNLICRQVICWRVSNPLGQ